MENNYPELIVECKDLKNGATFPIKYTHRGEEVSPEFILKNLSMNGKTITIIFDDLDHPMNHWIIWNLPAMDIIPGKLPENKILTNFGNCRQRSKYRGPNPPKGIKHKYQFDFYVLDCELKKINYSKNELIKAMEEHVIQYGFVFGYFE